MKKDERWRFRHSSFHRNYLPRSPVKKLFHRPLSNFFVSYNCIRSSIIITKPFPRTRIHRTFMIWLRHFLIRCFQSGNIKVGTASPSISFDTLEIKTSMRYGNCSIHATSCQELLNEVLPKL